MELLSQNQVTTPTPNTTKTAPRCGFDADIPLVFRLGESQWLSKELLLLLVSAKCRAKQVVADRKIPTGWLRFFWKVNGKTTNVM